MYMALGTILVLVCEEHSHEVNKYKNLHKASLLKALILLVTLLAYLLALQHFLKDLVCSGWAGGGGNYLHSQDAVGHGILF